MNSVYDILEEPLIPTEAGIRKPDIVAFCDGVAYVVDMTIVADNAVLNHDHLEKIKYYNQESIRKWICDRGNCNETVFLGAALN